MHNVLNHAECNVDWKNWVNWTMCRCAADGPEYGVMELVMILCCIVARRSGKSHPCEYILDGGGMCSPLS